MVNKTALSLKTLSILTVAILSACGEQVRSDCNDCGFYTDASGSRLMHWPDGTQIQFEFHRDFPEDKKQAMAAVGTVYNSAFAQTRLDIKTTSSFAPSFSGRNPDSVANSVLGDGINGIYWVEGEWPWAQENPNSDAMTLVAFEAGRIIEADLFFKADSFSENAFAKKVQFFDMSKLAENKTEKKSFFSSLLSRFSMFEKNTSSLAGEIIVPQEISVSSTSTKWLFVLGVHEIGHALGRVHSDSKSSVMYPSVGLSFSRNPLTESDLNMFSKAYTLNP
jgi:hypothetical protein